MNLRHEVRGKYLLIRVEGKLDASWSDYVTETLLGHIRNGCHHMVVDASELVFLSSAGIRALLQVYKALNTVHGSFRIVDPTPFVEQILSTAGFLVLLADGPPEDMPQSETTVSEEESGAAGIDRFTLMENASLTMTHAAGWHPWQNVDRGMGTLLSFPKGVYALGIGSSAEDFESARDQFGEFLAVAGNVVVQPPDEQGHPDYLISERQYVPKMYCIQSLGFSGEMAYLIRFAPSDKTPFHPVSGLMDHILAQTGGNAAGFVILGEIEGLVGAALIRSPGLLHDEREIPFPEIRDWLTFCGERSYSRRQALLTGMVCKGDASHDKALLQPVPSHPGMAVHVHAAVFPYQPLQNGPIGVDSAVQKFFSGPPPLAVMHLVDDIRPAVGLGQSALIRGACWFGPIQNAEVLS